MYSMPSPPAQPWPTHQQWEQINIYFQLPKMFLASPIGKPFDSVQSIKLTVKSIKCKTSIVDEENINHYVNIQ